MLFSFNVGMLGIKYHDELVRHLKKKQTKKPILHKINPTTYYYKYKPLIKTKKAEKCYH